MLSKRRISKTKTKSAKQKNPVPASIIEFTKFVKLSKFVKTFPKFKTEINRNLKDMDISYGGGGGVLTLIPLSYLLDTLGEFEEFRELLIDLES